MTANTIGVYYSLETGKMLRIRIPDNDWELTRTGGPNGLPYIPPGEGLIILPWTAYRFLTHDQLQNWGANNGITPG